MKWTAYDYTEQRWIEGEPARLELIRQQSERLALLESPDGERYAQMLGRARVGEITNARAALAELQAARRV